MQLDLSHKSSLSCIGELVDTKEEERAKLQETLDQLNEENYHHELELSSQLQEHESKLEEIVSEKRRVRTSLRQHRDKALHENRSLSKALKRTRSSLNKLERHSQNIDHLMNIEYSNKLEAFYFSLKPLEDATQAVIDERHELERKINDLESKKHELDQKLEALTAENVHTQRQIQVLNNNKSELAVAFEKIKLQFPLEYDEVVSEIETKQKLAELKERKSKQTTELRGVQKHIEESERDLNAAIVTLQRMQRQKTTGRKRNAEESDLIELERYISIQCTQFGIPSVARAVEEVAERYHLSMKNFILKEQFKIMEDRELRIIEEGKIQSESYQARIKEQTRLLSEKTQKILTAENPDKEIAATLLHLKQLREEANVSNRQHECKLSLIKKWKDENRKILLLGDSNTWPNDAGILTNIQTVIKRSKMTSEQAAAFESVLKRYNKYLNEREGLANAASETEFKTGNEIKEQENLINKLRSEVSSLQFEHDVIQREHGRLVSHEKAVLKRFHTAKYDIQVERKKRVHNKVSESLRHKAGDFKNVAKALGEKKMQQFKERELAKFHGEYERDQKTVRNKLEDLYNHFGFWDSQILNLLERSSPATIEKIENEINQINGEIRSLKNQLKIVINTEDELTAKIEMLVETKKQEISSRISHIMTKEGNVDLQRISNLKEKEQEYVEAVNFSENQLYLKQNQYCKDIERIEVEETKVKVKLQQLRKETQAILANKKKAASLQIKLGKINQSMKTMSSYESQSPVKTQTSETKTQSPVIVKPRVKLQEVKYEFNEKGATETEKILLEFIKPLLKGVYLYKKRPGKFDAFDPLVANSPFKHYGYELKILAINRHLTKIEIRNSERKVIENSFMLNQLIAPTVSKHTLEIVKAQRTSPDKCDLHPHEEEYENEKYRGEVKYDGHNFAVLSAKAKGFPFFISFKNGVKLELMSTDSNVLKKFMDKFKAFAKHSAVLAKLQYRIKVAS